MRSDDQLQHPETTKKLRKRNSRPVQLACELSGEVDNPSLRIEQFFPAEGQKHNREPCAQTRPRDNLRQTAWSNGRRRPGCWLRWIRWEAFGHAPRPWLGDFEPQFIVDIRSARATALR